MGFYADRVLPHLLEFGMRQMKDLRAPALARASGDVFEVGFGTALNLDHYPPAVKSLTGLDPMTALADRVERRIARAAFPVERVALPADQTLPFEDGRFDTVVATWTLCTIPDPAAALAEMRRVLKPGGLYLFIEHGRSEDPGVARWQDRVNPIQKCLAGGCNVNRPIDRLVEQGGFEIETLERFDMEKAPRIWGTQYQGVAR